MTEKNLKLNIVGWEKICCNVFSEQFGKHCCRSCPNINSDNNYPIAETKTTDVS